MNQILPILHRLAPPAWNHLNPGSGKNRSAAAKTVLSLLLLLLFMLTPGWGWGQATLPFTYDGGKPSGITGLTHTGLGSDYASSPKMKFDTQGDNLILNFTGAPGTLSFSIKWNQSNAASRFPGDFELLESSDGSTYTRVQLYNSTTGTALANGTVYTETFTTLLSATRYIKWNYTTKSNGNIAIGAISLAAPAGNTAPTVTTQAVNAISTTTATGNGNITATGGTNATARGVCWDVYANPDPTIANTHSTESGSFGTGAFTGSITPVTAETRYKAVAYATNTTGTGYGSAVNFWTFSTEPSAHSGSFGNSVISQTQIDLSFDAASTITNADGYIILQKTGSAPTGTPTDGIAYTVGTAIEDGTVAAIVASTSAVSASISSLSAGTHYYFTIIPYNYNGTNSETYNYKTDGTIPGTNGTTSPPNDVDSYVNAPATQADPVTISSLADTDPEAVEVYKFKINDVGTDGLLTKVTQVTINAGVSNAATWSSAIQGAKLSTDGGSTFVTTDAVTINAASIVFPISAGNLDITNGGNATVSLFIYLKSSGLTDNQIFQFNIPTASHGFTADATGSTFLTTFASATTSNSMSINVVASKLKFVQQPNDASPNTSMAPAVTVEAVDANNNRDLDYSTAITITSTGTLAGSPVTGSLASGLATFSTLTHTALGSNLQLTAASGSITSATSSTFSISSLLLVENFSYTTTSLLTANGWTAHSSAGTNPITVATATPSFTYAGYLSSGIGNEITLVTGSGEDDSRAFQAQTSGAVYASFLVYVTSATLTGDYFFHLGAITISTNFRGRIFVKRDASSNLAFGIAQSTTTPNYTEFSYSLNTPYLIVLKYNIMSGATNDVASIYINPALNAFEPSIGWITNTDAASTDLADVGTVALRQGSTNTPGLKLDGIRISTSWADIVGYPTTYAGTGNWSAAGNWSNGIPTSSDDAIVDGAVTIDVDAVAKNLTINTGKSVTINEAKSLTVSGTLTNSAGSTGLVINSDATGTGSLIYNSGTVAATVNRYVSGNPEAWHLFSSPVDAQAISGDFTPDGTYPDLSGYDLFAWDEPTATWVNRKNTIATPIGTGLRFDDVTVNNGLNFMVGKGYLAEYQAANPTKQFQGTLNTGTVSYTLTNSGSGTYKAYNLVGNPYPSAIDWKASLGWTREFVVTNVGSGKDMSIWNDAGSGNYGTYSSASLTDDGTNGATRYIPVGQGFMVEATSPAGAFEMNNDVRVHQNPSFLKASGEIANILRMKVSGNTNTYSDEIVVEFGHQTAEGGAEKMFSFYETAPSLYTVKPTGNYSIDFRGEPGAATIPMSFKAGADGNYTIQASQLETFTSSSSIILEDLKLAKTQNLMSNPAYTFMAVKGEDASRFLLHFGGTFSVCDKEIVKTFSISSSGNTLCVSSISGKTVKGEVTVFNMIGQPITHQLLSQTPVTRISLNAPTGYYLVKVVTSDHVYSTKVFINN